MRGIRIPLVMIACLIMIILSQPTITSQEFNESELAPKVVESTSSLSEEIDWVEIQITHTSSHDTNPILGQDDTSPYAVYTSRTDRSDGSRGRGEIWFQRLNYGVPTGLPVHASFVTRNDEFHDAFNNYIVFSSYDNTDTRVGEVVLYDIATGQHHVIGSSANLGKASIHGRMITWFEGEPNHEEIKLYDIAWIDQGLDPIVIWTNTLHYDLEVLNIDIGDRFAVWSGNLTEYNEGEILVFDLDNFIIDGAPVSHRATTSKPQSIGPWIVWDNQPDPNSQIIVYNMDSTYPQFISDSNANISRPAIDGNIISYESVGLFGNSDILTYDISSQEVQRVTDHLGDQYYSSVYDGLVAYVDARSGNEDVYIHAPVGEVDVTPTSVYFGGMYMDSDLADIDVPVTVSNFGFGPLIVESVSIFSAHGDDGGIFIGLDPTPTTLAPNEEIDIIVSFQAQWRGNHSELLRINCNDPDESAITIPLTGIGMAPFFDFYTPVGLDVLITDQDTPEEITGVALLFDNVFDDGVTTIMAPDFMPSTPIGFVAIEPSLSFTSPLGYTVTDARFNISTTAGYSDTIPLSIPYDETSVTDESNLRLMKWNSITESWGVATTSVDTVNNVIHGETRDLSIFALMEPVSWLSEPIYIDDNSDFLTLGFPGSGTEIDPYRIENLVISSESADLIHIQDTTAHFIIQDCQLNGLHSWQHPYPVPWYSGIFLSNVQYGLVSLNEITGCWMGIRMIDCSNNILSDNYLYDTDHDGIYMNQCSNNLLQDNTADDFVLDSCTYNQLAGNLAPRLGFYILLGGHNTFIDNTAISELRGFRLVGSSDNILTDNYAEGIEGGYLVTFSSDNNQLTNNVAFNCQIGFEIDLESSDNLLSFNIAQDCGTGFSIYGSAGNIIVSNYVSRSILGEIYDGIFGFVIGGCSQNELIDNTVSFTSPGPHLPASVYGIHLSDCGQITLEGNVVNIDCDYGYNRDIYGLLLSRSSNNFVSGNTFNISTNPNEEYTGDISSTFYCVGLGQSDNNEFVSNTISIDAVFIGDFNQLTFTSQALSCFSSNDNVFSLNQINVSIYIGGPFGAVVNSFGFRMSRCERNTLSENSVFMYSRPHVSSSNFYSYGIRIVECYGTLISNNSIFSNFYTSGATNYVGHCVSLFMSNYNNLSENLIEIHYTTFYYMEPPTESSLTGITLLDSGDNRLFANVIDTIRSYIGPFAVGYGCEIHGLDFLTSGRNHIEGNTISGSDYSIELEDSSSNLIFHNYISSDVSGLSNWYHPVLLEGNYWFDYPGLDDGSGTGKHAIAGDGIGDTYVPWRQDLYPLMTPPGIVATHDDPTTGVVVSFHDVSEDGSTSITLTEGGPDPELGFQLVGQYFDISTTVSHSGTITIAIPYDDSSISDESLLRLLHFDATWVDVTSWVDTDNNVIYGEVTSLSPFAIAEITRIFIDDETDFELYGFPGSGTESDPYIIEGFNLASDTSALIHIQDTSSWCIVRDCYLDGLHSDIWAAIYVRNAQNVLIENCNVVNSKYGIRLSSSSYVTVFNNHFVDCARSISIYRGDSNILTKNLVENSVYGLMLEDTNYNIVSNNTALNCLTSIGAWSGTANHFIANLVDFTSSPLAYDQIFGIYLSSCLDSVVSENQISIDVVRSANIYIAGFYIQVSTGFIVDRNNVDISLTLDGATPCSVYGFILLQFDGNTLSWNDVTLACPGEGLGYYLGIHLEESDDNQVYSNSVHISNEASVLDFESFGLRQLWCTNNILSFNHISADAVGRVYGIYLVESHDSEVKYNSVFNHESGIVTYYSHRNYFYTNWIENNNRGLLLAGDSTENIIEYNTFLNNYYCLGFVDSAFANLAFFNNFTSDVSRLYLVPEEILISNDLFFDASVGNYWSDYVGFDYNADGIGDTDLPWPVANGDLFPIVYDQDSDGLTDNQELLVYNTNHLNWDSDGDMLSDGDEIILYGTNPLDFDTDKDNLNDRDEIVYGCDPTYWDSDGDTLSDGEEYWVYGTSPTDHDSDDDGLWDSWEVLGEDEFGRYSGIFTDPNKPDTDDDNVGDYDEIFGVTVFVNGEYMTFYSNPQLKDSDDDGLWDSEEIFGVTVFAITGDWESDGEYMTFYSNPQLEDSDDDGFTDFEEIYGILWRGYLIKSTNPMNPDCDGDLLTDYEEWYWDIIYASNDPHSVLDELNPWDQDSDGDEISDGDEVLLYGTDPLSPVDTYTPPGASVQITDDTTGIVLNFDWVTDGGATTVEVPDDVPIAPAGYQLDGVIFDISTTALFEGYVEIGIPYDETTVGAETLLRLMHYNELSEEWEDITSWIDTENNIIYGIAERFSIFAVMEIIDSIKPTTTLSIEPSYFEGGVHFTTFSSLVDMSAIDDLSGVHHIEYRIDDGSWTIYMEPFSILDVGEHILLFRAIDNVGNIEDTQTVNIHLVTVDITSFLSDEVDPITSFDVILSWKKNLGGYKIVSTNPGQIFFEIDLMNTWPIDIDAMTLDLAIPEDFILKGTTPISIYLDGVDITTSCTIDGFSITLYGVPSGGVVEVKVHLEYGLIDEVFPTLDEFGLKGYWFGVDATCTAGDITVAGSGLFGTTGEVSSLTATQKKVTALAGYVTDSNGVPMAGVQVDLYDMEGNLLETAITDENGFYYFIDVDVGTFTVQIMHEGITYCIEATTVNRELTEVDFSI